MRRLISALLLSASACAAAQPSAPLLKTGTTMSGQPLLLPQGPAELVVTVRELPAGGMLPVHKHPWPRYVYLEKGRMVVVNHDAGLTREVKEGEVIAEAIDQWHEGRVVGDGPARLIVFDQVPPGRTNMVLKDPD